MLTNLTPKNSENNTSRCNFKPVNAYMTSSYTYARTESLLHGDLGALDLPAVGLGADAEHARLVALGRRVEQVEDETVGVRRVVVHQLGQVAEAVVSRHVHLETRAHAQ